MEVQTIPPSNFGGGVVYTSQIPNHKAEDRFSLGSFLLESLPPGNISLRYTLVLDGHGGTVCAEFINQELHSYLSSSCKHIKSINKIGEGIRKGIMKINKVFKKNYPKDKSGCTLNMMALIDDQLFVVNVGDSRAVEVKEDFSVINLSEEQNCFDPKERQRLIEKASKSNIKYIETTESARQDTKKLQMWFEKNNSGQFSKVSVLLPQSVRDFYEVGPTRSISVTSSMGDHVFGSLLSPEITITQHTISSDHPKLLISASDGLWGVISNESLGEMIKDYWKDLNLDDWKEGVPAMAKHLHGELGPQACEKYGVGNMRDDITTHVFYLLAIKK